MTAGDTGSIAPEPADPRALLGVLRGLRALAEGRHAGLGIAPGEYLADIYCIQRVAALLAMELSALGRTLRRPEATDAAAEVHAIEAILAQAFADAGLRLEACVLDLAEAMVRPAPTAPPSPHDRQAKGTG
jgi:hypothetical protein